MEGVRTAEEGGGSCRRDDPGSNSGRREVGGRSQALLGAPMAVCSGCAERDGGIGHGKRRSRTGTGASLPGRSVGRMAGQLPLILSTTVKTPCASLSQSGSGKVFCVVQLGNGGLLGSGIRFSLAPCRESFFLKTHFCEAFSETLGWPHATFP